MENKLNVPKLEYKTGEPMWVHWDNRRECFNDVIGRTPAEDLITTIGYLVYMVQIPMSLVASFGSFD